MSYCIHQGDCFGIDFEKKSFFFCQISKTFVFLHYKNATAKALLWRFFAIFASTIL